MALFELSLPVHELCVGVTEYFHEPAGTLFSVQASPGIVPEHPGPIGWSRLVVAS